MVIPNWSLRAERGRSLGDLDPGVEASWTRMDPALWDIDGWGSILGRYR